MNLRPGKDWSPASVWLERIRAELSDARDRLELERTERKAGRL